MKTQKIIFDTDPGIDDAMALLFIAASPARVAAQGNLENDPAFLAIHQQIADRNARILYRGTSVESYDAPTGRGQA